MNVGLRIILLIASILVLVFVAYSSSPKKPMIVFIAKYDENVAGPGLGHHGDFAAFDSKGKFIGILDLSEKK